MQIISGVMPKATKAVIYGPEGIGKTTFASKAPYPLFIDTEGSTTRLSVRRLPAPGSFAMIQEQIQFVLRNPTVCKTLVLDTADWAQRLCTDAVCAKYQKGGIEDFGYGKLGIFPDEIDNAGKAAMLLDKLDKRKSAGLTTPKQIRFLESRGFQHVGTWQFDHAKRLIDRIAANGWHIPRGIDPGTFSPKEA